MEDYHGFIFSVYSLHGGVPWKEQRGQSTGERNGLKGILEVALGRPVAECSTSWNYCQGCTLLYVRVAECGDLQQRYS